MGNTGSITISSTPQSRSFELEYLGGSSSLKRKRELQNQRKSQTKKYRPEAEKRNAKWHHDLKSSSPYGTLSTTSFKKKSIDKKRASFIQKFAIRNGYMNDQSIRKIDKTTLGSKSKSKRANKKKSLSKKDNKGSYDFLFGTINGNNEIYDLRNRYLDEDKENLLSRSKINDFENISSGSNMRRYRDTNYSLKDTQSDIHDQYFHRGSHRYDNASRRDIYASSDSVMLRNYLQDSDVSFHQLYENEARKRQNMILGPSTRAASISESNPASFDNYNNLSRGIRANSSFVHGAFRGRLYAGRRWLTERDCWRNQMQEVGRNQWRSQMELGTIPEREQHEDRRNNLLRRSADDRPLKWRSTEILR